jgi:hypothetical protein
VTTPSKILNDVLPHIAQVSNVLPRKSVDLTKIDRGTEPKSENPISILDQLIGCDRKEMIFGMGRKDSFPARDRVVHDRKIVQATLRNRYSLRLQNDSLGPLNQSFEGHESFLVDRHYRFDHVLAPMIIEFAASI